MKTVIDFGADPNGNIDSTEAFQLAISSEHAISPAAGLFKILGTLIFDKPKIFQMLPPLFEPFEIDHRKRPSRAPGPLVPESHTRLWTDQDNTMIEIRSPEVFIKGGVFDVQKATGRRNPVIRYINGQDHNGRPAGWRGSIIDFMILGNYLELGDSEGAGCDGILVDLENTTIANAYWTHLKWQGMVAGLKCGWKSTLRNSELRHWANTCSIELEAKWTKQAVYNEAFGGLKVSVLHQGGYCFASQAEAAETPSIYSKQSIQLCNQKFFDFDDQSLPMDKDKTKVWWFNNCTIDLRGQENVIDDTDSNTFTRAKYLDGTKPRDRLDNARGFLPWLATGQSLHGVVIPPLHDALYEQLSANAAHHLVNAYIGNSGSLSSSSVSDDISTPKSTAITIARPEFLFKYSGTFTEFVWMPEAIERNDYVELVLKCKRSLRHLWITFAGSPKQLQLILSDNNKIISDETKSLWPRENFRPIPIQFAVPLATFDQIIIRFIGNYGDDDGRIQMHSISGTETRHKWKTPFMLDF